MIATNYGNGYKFKAIMERAQQGHRQHSGKGIPHNIKSGMNIGSEYRFIRFSYQP